MNEGLGLETPEEGYLGWGRVTGALNNNEHCQAGSGKGFPGRRLACAKAANDVQQPQDGRAGPRALLPQGVPLMVVLR